MKMLSSFLALVALSFAGSLPAKTAAAKSGATTAAEQIDALLAKDWKANKLTPNAPAADDVFVRRVYLDVVGRIPTFRENEEFMNSKDADKRAKLIDKLLASEGYVQHMFNFWADILRAQSSGQQTGGITGAAYTNFIKDSLRKNKPYNQFVREMIASQGKAWDNGAIGYYMRDRGMPLDNLANTVRVFLGTRIECAQCHNHPFDKWTQKQFYEMAAFTYGVETNDYYGGPMKGVRQLMNDKEAALRQKVKLAGGKMDDTMKAEQEDLRQSSRHMNEALTRVRDPLRYTTVDYRDKKLTLPHDYKYPDAAPKSVVKAATMMGKPVDCPPGVETLEAYADWMTSTDNPRFTTVVANRLWKKLFGMGLIEPVDELMDNTVAMNPDLMKYLEKYMVSINYDMKTYLRTLLNTKTYQRAVSRDEVPAGVAYHFTGPLLRRMSAEQMWDSFVALINPTPDMANMPVREQQEKRVLGAKKINDALETLTPEEMYKGAEVAAGKYKEQASKLKELQSQIAEARAAEDKDKVKELSKQANELQRTALKAVNDNIFVPAVKKLYANVSGKKGPELKGGDEKSDTPAGEAGMMSMMGMGMGGDFSMDKVSIPGYDKVKKTPEEEKAERDQQRAVALEEAAYFGIPEKEQKQYINYRAQQTRNWVRAAEIESPAPRGHYLREFGQSDREFIENANYDASVPQVLAVMNGTLLPQILDKYSQLMLTINKAPYADEKVEAAYLTLFSRKPTAKEKDLWLQAQDKGLSTMEDLIYSLINTQQFIFIQ